MRKTWFITGTSTGFGRILTEKLLARGDRVAATLRSPDVLAGLKTQYGEQLWIEALDVTDGAAIRRVVDKAFEDLGRVDVVVNNAGYALFGAAEELSEQQMRLQLDTNVMGSMQVTQAALPHLRRQEGGRILQVSSMGGQIALPALSLYHASKWAIEGFFESVIQEVAPFGIEVTIVEPAGANTHFAHGSMVHAIPMADYADTPVGKWRAERAAGNYNPTLDPEKAVQAMIDSVDVVPAPKRLVLGARAFELVHRALTERLAALEAQKDLAIGADYDAAR